MLKIKSQIQGHIVKGDFILLKSNLEQITFLEKYIKVDFVKNESKRIFEDVDKSIESLGKEFKIFIDGMLAVNGDIG